MEENVNKFNVISIVFITSDNFMLGKILIIYILRK